VPGCPDIDREIPVPNVPDRGQVTKAKQERNMTESFKDKVAIVTGGASGIGQALCEELGRRGAKVVAADINREGAEQVAAAISVTGGKAEAARLDVTRSEEVQKLIDRTASRNGRLDYMFNNAGVANLGEARDMMPGHWDRIIQINLMGVVYGTTAAYSLMVKQGFGHIVNTASQAGLYPVSGTTSYALTKHGVVGLSTSLRTEGVGLGVKVSVVCPGPVVSRIVEDATLLGAYRKNVFSEVPQFMLMDTAKAARVILRGVARNRAIIIFPFHARFLWWLHRISPAIPGFLARVMTEGNRRYRIES
jgi:NAD(P)-dependent dehydrogenase (short-subunit alcohol dehydrogenase family)